MRLTIRGPQLRGDRCAPTFRPASGRRVLLTLLLTVVAAANFCAAASAAEDELVLAQGSFYADSGFGQMQGPFTGTVDVNTLLGAHRFYNAGFTGTNAVMANVEAGYIWSGHEALSHVQQIPTSGITGEPDRHATWVALLMGGRLGGANPGYYQSGMAPNAQLFSGAISAGWSGTRFTTSFSISTTAAIGAYRLAMQDGITGAGGTRTADVVNSSWQTTNFTGNDSFAGTVDALINANPHTLHVTAAGNLAANVPSPGAAYNDLTVGALAFNGGAYDIVASFSNDGPNDYNDPVNGTILAARQVVDLVAPGQELSTAYYGGQTGGNGPSLPGIPGGLPGGPDYYSRAVQGTSFSSPLVAGGAALLYDTAYANLAINPDARNARVMKAVLKNSADKLAGWNNGQAAHPNGNGGVLTTRGLDDRSGAGRLNLDTAFDQFLSGTTDVVGSAGGAQGLVETVGWDFGQVTQSTTNDYLLDAPLAAGSTFTASLDWFRDRAQSGTTSFIDQSQDNLDLELWQATGGLATSLIAESKSVYNNFEHFSFAIPTEGEYLLRVRWTSEIFDTIGDTNAEFYGLAWAGVAVPEPGTLMLFAVLLPLLGAVRRRR